MVFYSESAVERTMKIQEVILRAMAKKITGEQAAEIIGISDRQMRRWYGRYREFGYDGLFDRRLAKTQSEAGAGGDGGASAGTVPREVFRSERAALLREAARAARHRAELHVGQNGFARSGTGEQGALPRGAPSRRARRPLPGMLLHLDGSRHRWFGDERWYDLLVMLDDATSEVYYAQLVEQESTRTVMAALREVIERKGVFCALYSDRASHFFDTPKRAGRSIRSG